MKSILGRGLLGTLSIAFPALLLAADPPDSAPSDASPNSIAPHAWELTPYLKGTSAEIRDKMNGEVERLAVKVRETEAAIKQENIDCTNDEKEILAKVHKSEAYRQAAAEANKAAADLEVARKSGSSQDRLTASARSNKAKAVLDTFDHDALVKSDDLTRDRHALADSQKNLKRFNESLDKAVVWRNELLDDTRNGFMMKAPLVDGARGTLPKVTVQKVVDDKHVIVEFEALTVDTDHPGKDIEGIKVYTVTKSTELLLVSGVDTKGLKKDDRTNFDRNFVIKGSTLSETGQTIHKALLAPEDSDDLFEKIVNLREPLPARFANKQP
jgi:hypothetical protein